mmetsp:Transcript_2446/g.9909  ORF Transcript_2446/g.9909 Transcript_2446/m.9909 type:complete len:423 (+) Transcript_2446:1540-2808(+)
MTATSRWIFRELVRLYLMHPSQISRKCECCEGCDSQLAQEPSSSSCFCFNENIDSSSLLRLLLAKRARPLELALPVPQPHLNRRRPHPQVPARAVRPNRRGDRPGRGRILRRILRRPARRRQLRPQPRGVPNLPKRLFVVVEPERARRPRGVSALAREVGGPLLARRRVRLSGRAVLGRLPRGCLFPKVRKRAEVVLLRGLEVVHRRRRRREPRDPDPPPARRALHLPQQPRELRGVLRGCRPARADVARAKRPDILEQRPHFVAEVAEVANELRGSRPVLVRPVRVARRRGVVRPFHHAADVRGLERLGVIAETIGIPAGRPRLGGDLLGGLVQNLERRRGLVHVIVHVIVLVLVIVHIVVSGRKPPVVEDAVVAHESMIRPLTRRRVHDGHLDGVAQHPHLARVPVGSHAVQQLPVDKVF